MQKPIFTTAAAAITLAAFTASPAQARFLQTDPIGYEDGPNLYAYVGNDPINGIDPTGECGVDADGNKAGLCPPETDTAAANILSAQLSNPNSIASEVEAQAISQGENIPFTTDPNGTNSSGNIDGVSIGLQPHPIEVSDVGSTDVYTRDMPIDERVEHELDQVQTGLNGGSDGLTGTIKVSGALVDVPISITIGDVTTEGNLGSLEASAINRTNQYRGSMGRTYRRVTYRRVTF